MLKDDFKNAHLLLAKYWQQIIEGLPARPSIQFCHRTGNDYEDFQPFGGLQAAREILMLQINKSEPLQPILIFGFQSKFLVRDKANEYWPGSGALFDWPGAEYLRYDITPDKLREAARRVIEGSKQPLPKNFLPKDPSELLCISSEIRHWLENLEPIVTGTLKNFHAALRGGELSPFHLNSQSAISREHRDMVNRLWAYESLAVEFSPTNGGLLPLRAAMSEFEQAWSEFNMARESYCLALENGTAGKDRINSVIIQLEKVVSAVQKAIEATDTLDAALKKR